MSVRTLVQRFLGLDGEEHEVTHHPDCPKTRTAVDLEARGVDINSPEGRRTIEEAGENPRSGGRNRSFMAIPRVPWHKDIKN